MNTASAGAGRPGDVRKLLHDLSDELSVAMLQLELLLERNQLDETSVKAVAETLEACRRAASSLRQVWRSLDAPGDVG
jgi:hypothetical protein